jgi:toxin YoeB
VSETKRGGPKKRVVVIQPECLQDLRHWVTNNPKTADRMLRMIEETLKTPFEGIGKPEALKHLGPNIWSRRLTGEDRLVYRVADDLIDFLQGRYHY